MKKNVINVSKLAYKQLSNAQKSSKSNYILFSIFSILGYSLVLRQNNIYIFLF